MYDKQKFKEYLKRYYQLNKEKINARRFEDIECECGTILYFNSYRPHLKTNKHKRLLDLKKHESGL